MKIKYNKKWIPVNEAMEFTDKDFDKRFKIERKFMFWSLFRKNFIRFVKYPNENKITVFYRYIRRPIFIHKFSYKYLEKNYNKNKFIKSIMFFINTKLFYKSFDCGTFNRNEIKNIFKYEILTEDEKLILQNLNKL